MKRKDWGGTPIQMAPIGIIRNALHLPESRAETSEEKIREARSFQKTVQEMKSELLVFDEYLPLLDGVEQNSHILVLFWAHLIDPEKRKIQKVHPMGRKDLPEKGVFATCSPARPNPVLVSTVPLMERRGDTLIVSGLEAIDGTPLIDIKPYVHKAHGADDPRIPDWMARLHKDLE